MVFDKSLSQSYKLRNPISDPQHTARHLLGGLPSETGHSTRYQKGKSKSLMGVGGEAF